MGYSIVNFIVFSSHLWMAVFGYAVGRIEHQGSIFIIGILMLGKTIYTWDATCNGIIQVCVASNCDADVGNSKWKGEKP